MKFFTPELFVRFNSADDEGWEAAIRAYRAQLEGLRDQMPSQVRKLAGLCLHDAEVLACDQPIEPLFSFRPFEPFPIWSGLAILSIRQGDEISSLIYVLWDSVSHYPAGEGWPFSKARRHWLYDEVDVSPNHPGMFVHRVLLSDGTTMEIPFLSALIHSISLIDQPEVNAPKQIA